jgi:hypothetical protein
VLKAIIEKIGDIQALAIVESLITTHTGEYAEFTGMYLNQVP